MDMITLAMAKAYTDSKQLAYSEPGKTLLDVALTDGRKVVDYKIGLEVGKTYIVTTDSGTYTAVCKKFMDVIPYLGNLSVLSEDQENTGETFVVSEYMEDGNVIVTAVDQNGGSHIKVSQPDTIVPIDQKYLPGVCLPVVELSTTFENGVVFKGEDQQKLTEAYKRGMPTIIQCDISVGGAEYSNARMVWSLAGIGGADYSSFCFVASVGGAMLLIMALNMGGDIGDWNCIVQ